MMGRKMAESGDTSQLLEEQDMLEDRTDTEGIPGTGYTNREPENLGFSKRLYLRGQNGKGGKYDSA
ncbi:hypothetical protein STEG23_025520, partial [Scotinomys teguina]